MTGPDKPKRGIRRRVAILIMFATGTIASLGIIVGYWSGFQLLGQTMERDYTMMARLLAASMTRMIDEEINDLEVFVSSPMWQAAVREKNLQHGALEARERERYFMTIEKGWSENDPIIQEYLVNPLSLRLRQLVGAESTIKEIFLTDRFGGVVGCSGKTSDFYQADEEWWQWAFGGGEGAVFVGEVEFDESSRAWALPFAVPMKDGTGEVIGVCKAIVDMKTFWDTLESFTIGETGHAVLVNEDGYILFHPEIKPLSVRLTDEKEFAQVRKRPNRWTLIRHSPVYTGTVLGIFSEIHHPVFIKTGQHWLISLIQDKDEAFGPFLELMGQMVLVTVLMVALMALTGIVFAGRFVRPIDRLSEAAGHIARGDWEYRVDVKTGDELEQLADTLNAMAQYLKTTTVSIDTLREAQERFRIVARSTSDLIWEWDIENGTLQWFGDIDARLGYGAGEFPRTIQAWEESVHPDDRDSVLAALNHHLKDREPYQREYRILKKDGSVAYWMVSGIAEWDKEGRAYKMIGAVNDVTGRKRSEANLLKLSQSFLMLGPDYARNIQSLTVVCGEILEGAYAIYKRLDGDGILRSVGRWRTPEDYGTEHKPDGHICHDVIKRGSEGGIYYIADLPGTPYAQTDPHVARYGVRTYIGYPVHCLGQTIGCLCIFYQDNRTVNADDRRILGIFAAAIGIEEERRHAEKELKEAYENLKTVQAQLIQSEKMAGIGQLSAGVAHEINNPTGFVMSNLETLQGYAQKLFETFDEFEAFFNASLPQDPEKARILRDHLEVIKKNNTFDYIRQDIPSLIEECLDGADRIKGIVSNLRSFAHTDTGDKCEIDLNEELEKSLNLVWNELKYKCEVTKEYDGEMPRILASPGQLDQVFVNILINAVQAIPERGRVHIRTYKKSGYVYAEISDTGGGIPEEIRARIFEPFFTTKEVGKGTGLGLSIAYGIITNHNGTLEVESKVGEGTTFRIGLPISMT
ncbi:MAG: PAS domain-containing protein [Candidatus Omnitrophica bacterium]|nr:PAS domain-containing protein [Candidatus Omnitrophota bacterium]